MNAVVMRLALRSLLGSSRVWILVALSVLLLAVAGLTRWGSGADAGAASDMIVNFGFGLLVPIMCLLIGTGVIAAELEDGSIVYLLAKPLARRTVVLSKLVVAAAVALVFSVVSIVIAAEIAGDDGGRLAQAMGVTAALASIVYVCVFFMIALLTRNPIIVGLICALLWEGVLAGYVPGVRVVSVRQWALAPAQRMLDSSDGVNVTSDVGLVPALVLLALTTVAAVVISIQRAKSLTLRVSD